MGSGLCAAIAARMGVDVVLVRVAFALLALSGGLGVALYAWGTALTRSPTGVRPMDALLPAFARWTPTAPKVVVNQVPTVVTRAVMGSACAAPLVATSRVRVQISRIAEKLGSDDLVGAGLRAGLIT